MQALRLLYTQPSCYVMSSSCRNIRPRNMFHQQMRSRFRDSSAKTAYRVHRIRRIDPRSVPHSYEVTAQAESMTLASFKSELQLHARDLLALVVHLNKEDDGGYRYEARHHIPLRPTLEPYLILVRDKCVLVSFGHIKAIVMTDNVVIFEPDDPLVAAFIEKLVETLRAEQLQEQTDPQAFELFVLEFLLNEGCDSIDRRIELCRALMNNVIDDADSAQQPTFSSSTIHKLAPLTDFFYEFELEIKAAKRCVMELLHDDEDMFSLQLARKQQVLEEKMKTAQLRKQQNRTTVGNMTLTAGDYADHDEAQLLLENYALRLSQSMNKILTLQQKVKNQQSLADLNMQVRRNRLLRFNVKLSAAAIGISSCSAVTSAFGMNLVSGLEAEPYVFHAVILSTMIAALTMYRRLVVYVRGNMLSSSSNYTPPPLWVSIREAILQIGSNGRRKRIGKSSSSVIDADDAAGGPMLVELTERQLLENIFSNLQAVDLAVHTACERVKQQQLLSANDTNCSLDSFHLTRDSFAEIYAEINGVSIDALDRGEVEAVFRLVDIDGDGILKPLEVLKIEKKFRKAKGSHY